MSDKHHEHEVEVNHTLNNVVSFWNKNQKIITGVVIALIVVVGGYFGYSELIAKPNETKAADILYKSEQYFAAAVQYGDTAYYQRALKGDGVSSKGFLSVIKTYGSTPSGNLAKYYAGVCYLKLGDFNNAVKYLNDFGTDAKQVQLMAYGALGDAYSELNKKSEAIAAYKKAATTFEGDEANSSEYLFRAALLSEATGNTKEALDLYKQLKDKFPRTDKGYQADKYIYRLSVEKNEFTVK